MKCGAEIKRDLCKEVEGSGLHGCIFKSFHFHIVAFSNRSTFDCVFKCLRFHDRLHRLHMNRRWKCNDIVAFSSKDTFL